MVRRYLEWVRFALEILIAIVEGLLDHAFLDVVSRGHIELDQVPRNERIIDKPEGVGEDEDDSDGIVQPNRRIVTAKDPDGSRESDFCAGNAERQDAKYIKPVPNPNGNRC